MNLYSTTQRKDNKMKTVILILLLSLLQGCMQTIPNNISKPRSNVSYSSCEQENVSRSTTDMYQRILKRQHCESHSSIHR